MPQEGKRKNLDTQSPTAPRSWRTGRANLHALVDVMRSRYLASFIPLSGIAALLVTGLLVGRAAIGCQQSVISWGGFLHFVGQEELARLAGTDGPAELLARFPKTGDRLEALAEQLRRARSGAPGEGCASAAWVRGDLSERDLASRSAESDAAFVGHVIDLQPGWSTYYERPAALMRLAIETLIQDQRTYLRGAPEVLAIVPVPRLQVADAVVCAERGPWPELKPGDRFLLNAFWIGTDPPLLGAIDVIPIRDGVFSNPGFRSVDLPEPATEEAFLAGFRARGWLRE